ncbi:MAG: hypothetical protein BWY11_01990 [Firmicutes bacterium ADurb.Bin182]|nr:MAG: hypothetical protein BWY11_01990 [Firmicutes bacterium ADurb.Bin182]
MKKFVILIFSLFFVFAFAGCSGSETVLKSDEYNIYQNRKLIAEVTEQKGMYYFDTDVKSILSKYEGITFSTKRGISIGSSIEDVYRKYKGISCIIYGGRPQKIISYDDLLNNDNAPERYSINFGTKIINGKMYDLLTPDKDIAKDLGIDLMDWLKIRFHGSEDYIVETFEMQIRFENNKVRDITIIYM